MEFKFQWKPTRKHQENKEVYKDETRSLSMKRSLSNVYVAARKVLKMEKGDEGKLNLF